MASAAAKNRCVTAKTIGFAILCVVQLKQQQTSKNTHRIIIVKSKAAFAFPYRVYARVICVTDHSLSRMLSFFSTGIYMAIAHGKFVEFYILQEL